MGVPDHAHRGVMRQRCLHAMAVRLRIRSSAGATDNVTVEKQTTLAALKSLLVEGEVARCGNRPEPL